MAILQSTVTEHINWLQRLGPWDESNVNLAISMMRSDMAQAEHFTNDSELGWHPAWKSADCVLSEYQRMFAVTGDEESGYSISGIRERPSAARNAGYDAAIAGLAVAGVAAVGAGLFKGAKAAAVGVARAAAINDLEARITEHAYNAGRTVDGHDIINKWAAENSKLNAGLDSAVLQKRVDEAFNNGWKKGLQKRFNDAASQIGTALIDEAKAGRVTGNVSDLSAEGVEAVRGIINSIENHIHKSNGLKLGYTAQQVMAAGMEAAVNNANKSHAKIAKEAAKAKADSEFQAGWFFHIGCIAFILGGVTCGPIGWFGSVFFGVAWIMGINKSNKNKARKAAQSAGAALA